MLPEDLKIQIKFKKIDNVEQRIKWSNQFQELFNKYITLHKEIAIKNKGKKNKYSNAFT